MHDIKSIRENPEAFDAALKRRGLPGEAKRLVAIDERRRATIQKAEAAQARRNAASKEIGEAKKKKDEAAAAKLMAEVAEVKAAIPALEAEEKAASKQLADALAWIPNLPLPEVPDGADEHGNVEHHKFGAKREYGFAPKQHFDIGVSLGQMDFEGAAKLSGARFVVLKKGLARLERALGQFMLDLHTSEHGYSEVAPPLLVHDDVMFGTAQLPKFREDQFSTVNQSEVTRVSNELIEKSIRETANRIPQILGEIEKETGRQVDPAHALRRAADVINADMLAYRAELQEALTEAFRYWLIPTAEAP